MRCRTRLLLSLLLWGGLVLRGHAATVTAASCQDTAVQSAINSAVSGDTVVVPAGTCTWTTTVLINGKGLTLRGAGIGQTIIINQGDQSMALNASNLTASTFLRVTGFTWQQGSIVAPAGQVHITGLQGAQAFRFDHNRILLTQGSVRGLYIGAVFGLVDHNVFDATAASGSIQAMTVDGTNPGADPGFTPWSQPLSYGTDKAVFFEDNTITFVTQDEDSLDAYTGARIVYRHNTVNNAAIGFHGTDSGGQRSLFSIEEYRNTFMNNGANQRQGLRLRGGTALVWSNIFGGTKGYYGFTPLVYRATDGANTFTWGYCDGTQWDLGSLDHTQLSGVTAVAAGTGVRWVSTAPDTQCSSGATCTRYLDGAGSHGYPCRDQVGRTQHQALAPFYQWDNGTLQTIPFDGGNPYPPGNTGMPLSTWLLENRDFYNFQPAFDGTAGTGMGLLSARPPTCTPLVVYWATDTETLYQCATANTWSVYYQPYQYPHPFQLIGAPSVAITAPTTAPTFTTSTTPLTTLAGTASDADGTVSSVTWANDRGGSGTATGTTTWNVASLPLQMGANVLTITATDNEGMQQTTTLTVTLQTTPPAQASPPLFINGNLLLAGFLNACYDTGTLNAYACTPDSRLTAYVPLTCYSILAANGNTAASTLNLSAIGPVPIRKFQGANLVPLVSGDIRAGQIVHVCFDGSVMQCQNCGS